jgi:hypothetical protein
MTVKTKLLRNRGIGTFFHNQSLTTNENPKAKDVLEWITEKANNHLSLGRSLSVYSTKGDGYTIAILAARALILSGYDKLECRSLTDAVEPEFISHIYDKHPPLMLLNFDPNSVDEEAYRKLENCLVYYLDNMIPVFLHIPFDNADDFKNKNEYVSSVFFDRVNYANYSVTV